MSYHYHHNTLLYNMST